MPAPGLRIRCLASHWGVDSGAAGGGGVSILNAGPCESVATIESVTPKPSPAALVGVFRLERSLFVCQKRQILSFLSGESPGGVAPPGAR